MNDAAADGYVECDECGHPLECHSTAGCSSRAEGCTCTGRWTVKEIARVRREAGLPTAFDRFR